MDLDQNIRGLSRASGWESLDFSSIGADSGCGQPIICDLNLSTNIKLLVQKLVKDKKD